MSAPVGFLSQLCDGLGQLIADAGLGISYDPKNVKYAASATGLFVMAVPSTPNRIVVLTPYPSGDDATLPDSTIGLQIRTRSAAADPRDVLTLDDSIADLLLGNWPITLPNDVRVGCIERTSAVSLGQDDSLRWGWSSNYRLSGCYRRSPHRP